MNIMRFDEIDSTQEEAKRMIKRGELSSSSVLIAAFQTKGSGTHGRVWESEKGKNILMTIVLFPNCNIKQLEGLTVHIAEDVVKIIKELYKIKLDIKEPNDIILNGKKLGGILTETTLVGEQVTNLLIGIGININQEEFPEELKGVATSLKKDFHREFDKEKIIESLLDLFNVL